jgi:hypothetical protein
MRQRSKRLVLTDLRLKLLLLTHQYPRERVLASGERTDVASTLWFGSWHAVYRLDTSTDIRTGIGASADSVNGTHLLPSRSWRSKTTLLWDHRLCRFHL